MTRTACSAPSPRTATDSSISGGATPGSAGASRCEGVALYGRPFVPYDQLPMRISALALAALTLAPAAALAKPKVQSASAGTGAKLGYVCGEKVLPLAVGNVWTYSTVAAPTPALPDVARIAPQPPKTFTITVKSIDTPKGGDTVVSLEEKITYDLTKDPKKPVLDERVVHSTITCNAKKFDISP